MRLSNWFLDLDHAKYEIDPLDIDGFDALNVSMGFCVASLGV